MEIPLTQAKEYTNPPERTAFLTGYEMGLCDGALLEACKRNLTDYSAIIPRTYYGQMHKLARELDFRLFETDLSHETLDMTLWMRVTIAPIIDNVVEFKRNAK